MSDEPGGWIAFEALGGLSNSNKFWLDAKNSVVNILDPSAWNYDDLAYNDPDDSSQNLAAPADKNFSPMSNMEVKVSREYAGINSSGGPQVAGRADHEEIEISRVSDVLSPLLYQFVSTGEAFNRVFIVLRELGGDSPRVEWLLEGVNLTEYSFTGGHYWSDTDLIYSSQTSTFQSATQFNCDAPKYYQRVEKFRLLYTAARTRCGLYDSTLKTWTTSTFRGWDTGTNTRITDYPAKP